MIDILYLIISFSMVYIIGLIFMCVMTKANKELKDETKQK